MEERGGGGQGKETCLGGGRFAGEFISRNTLYFQPPTARYLCSFKRMFDRSHPPGNVLLMGMLKHSS